MLMCSQNLLKACKRSQKRIHLRRRADEADEVDEADEADEIADLFCFFPPFLGCRPVVCRSMKFQIYLLAPRTRTRTRTPYILPRTRTLYSWNAPVFFVVIVKIRGVSVELCTNLRDVSANTGESFSAKCTNCRGKSLMPCCSVPWNLFNEVHNACDNLVFN